MRQQQQQRQQGRGLRGAVAAAAAGCLALLAVSSLPAPALAAEAKARPFSRLQATAGTGEQETAATTTTKTAATEPVPTGAMPGTAEGARARKERLRPSEKLAFLQNIMRNGGEVDPLEMLQMGANSKGFQVLLNNAEIQHRIMEELPMLAAFDGFKQARGRRLSDEDTKASFAQGVQNVLNFAKDAFTKIKDPTKTAETIAKMAADPDPAMQDLFRRAKAGEKEAVFDLQDRFNDIHFPGVDARVLREVAAKHTFDKLLGMPEVMRFIDRDEMLSKVFRDPEFLRNGQEFFGTGNGGGGGAGGTSFSTGDGATTTFNSPEAAANKAFADAFELATGTPIGGDAAPQQP